MVNAPMGIQRSAPLETCPIKSGSIKNKILNIYKCLEKIEITSKSNLEKIKKAISPNIIYRKYKGNKNFAIEFKINKLKINMKKIPKIYGISIRTSLRLLSIIFLENSYFKFLFFYELA